MAHKRKLGFLARPLAVQSRFRIGARLMGLIAAFLSVEVYRRIARVICLVRGTRVLFLLKTLLSSPRLDQCPVSCSGGIDGRPTSEYNLSNRLERLFKTGSTILRRTRNG